MATENWPGCFELSGSFAETSYIPPEVFDEIEEEVEPEPELVEFDPLPEIVYQQVVERPPTKAEDQIMFLERLAQLRCSGAITEGEYQTKKWDILSRQIV